MERPESAAIASRRPPLDDELDVYGVTHPGKVRTVNQDHFLIGSLQKLMHVTLTSLPDPSKLPLRSERLAYLMVVADGVGGGQGGEQASRLAIENVMRYIQHSMRCYYSRSSKDEDFLEALTDAAYQCHLGVMEEAEEHPELRGMATTLTLALGVWPRAYVLQIGDSRCYLLRQGELMQITRDQTMAQELVDQNVMTRADADRTQWANVLSSAIGGTQTAPVVSRLEDPWDDTMLLCSDGLTKHVPDDVIRDRLIHMTSARQVTEQLLEDALDGGGSDNITILVGRVRR